MTAVLILTTAILSDPIEFKEVPFMVMAHLFFVALLGVFAIKLSLQGGAFTSVIHVTKMLLVNAMIQVESDMNINSKRTRFSFNTLETSMVPTVETEDFERALRRSESARMVALHLQECPTVSKEINSCELLGIFPLERSVVSGIFFSGSPRRAPGVPGRPGTALRSSAQCCCTRALSAGWSVAG